MYTLGVPRAFLIVFAFLGTRVRLIINAFDLLEGRVRVDLSCTERSVSEQFLNRPYVCAVIQHRRREGMAQHVRRVFLERRDFPHPIAHDGV